MDDPDAVDAGGRFVLRGRLIGEGKSLALALAGLPAQHIGEALGHRAAVAEDEPVEMVADGALVIGIA